MKNVKFGLLALGALVGVTSAFTTKGNARFNRSYGVTGVFSDGGVNHYNVKLFGTGHCNALPSVTCSGTIADGGQTVATVLTTAFTKTKNGTYIQ